MRELPVVFIVLYTTGKNNPINPVFLNLIAEQHLRKVIVSLEIIMVPLS